MSKAFKVLAGVALATAMLLSDGLQWHGIQVALGGGGDGGGEGHSYGSTSEGGSGSEKQYRLNQIPDLAVEAVLGVLSDITDTGVRNTTHWHGTWEQGHFTGTHAPGTDSGHDDYGGQNRAGPAGESGGPMSGNA